MKAAASQSTIHNIASAASPLPLTHKPQWTQRLWRGDETRPVFTSCPPSKWFPKKKKKTHRTLPIAYCMRAACPLPPAPWQISPASGAFDNFPFRTWRCLCVRGARIERSQVASMRPSFIRKWTNIVQKRITRRVGGAKGWCHMGPFWDQNRVV